MPSDMPSASDPKLDLNIKPCSTDWPTADVIGPTGVDKLFSSDRPGPPRAGINGSRQRTAHLRRTAQDGAFKQALPAWNVSRSCVAAWAVQAISQLKLTSMVTSSDATAASDENCRMVQSVGVIARPLPLPSNLRYYGCRRIPLQRPWRACLFRYRCRSRHSRHLPPLGLIEMDWH